MGNCGSTLKNNTLLSSTDIPPNIIDKDKLQSQSQQSYSNENENEVIERNGISKGSTQIAKTEMFCSTPEIDEDILQSVNIVYSASLPNLLNKQTSVNSNYSLENYHDDSVSNFNNKDKDHDNNENNNNNNNMISSPLTTSSPTTSVSTATRTSSGSSGSSVSSISTPILQIQPIQVQNNNYMINNNNNNNNNSNNNNNNNYQRTPLLIRVDSIEPPSQSLDNKKETTIEDIQIEKYINSHFLPEFGPESRSKSPTTQILTTNSTPILTRELTRAASPISNNSSNPMSPPIVAPTRELLIDIESESIDPLDRIKSLFNGPPTPQQLAAIQRIQRLARVKSAWRMAEVEREWKIFNDLDTQDEADMLNLACFMQTLLDWLPENQEKTEPLKHISIDLEDDSLSSSDLDGSINIDNIQLSVGRETIHGNIYDYMLPKGPITSDVASKIVAVYKRNGKLSIKSIQKILRIVYKVLKDRPNLTQIEIKRGEKLTIVGDLHGQLGDLFHILDESGWPSPTNKYIFNGDFVDRGIQGIEVVCVLLALHAAMPEYVFLNRGNHEDHAICCVYGFQRECKEKYDELTFGMFVEVFRHIPLFAVVNNSVFVVHGGLFHDVNVKLQDLNDIDRTDYVAKPPIPYPECTDGLSPFNSRKEYLKQLQRDALWSDPNDIEILAKNQRGSGVVFGPEVTRRFLSNNGLSMIIRSHECVRNGFDLPFSGFSRSLLGTIFSASNYCGGSNSGAYLVFSLHKMSNSIPVNGCNLYYTVHSYQLSDVIQSLKESNKISIYELILKRQKALLQAFEINDPENIGRIPKITFADIMQRVTQLKILWLRTIYNLCPQSVFGNLIDYRIFLSSFNSFNHFNNSSSGTNLYELNMLSMDSMYGQRAKLEAVFRYFDKNGDGAISRSEFRLGCDFMNTTLPPHQQLKDYDHILTLMDFDQSDTIDINEFFEVFRLLDAKDGVVDGVLSIAQPNYRK